MRAGWKSDPTAQAARFMACGLLLFQAQLAAGELSDPLFFAAAIALASAAGIAGALFGLRAWFFAALACAFPFALRPFLSASAVFGLERVLADGLLLSYDRNLLIALPAAGWAAAAAYAAKRSAAFLRWEPAVNGAALALFFLVVDIGKIAGYQKPIVPAAVFAALAFLEAVVLFESAPPILRAAGRERIGSAAVVLGLCALAVALTLDPFQEKAAARGGGLIKPSLFRFDFSQYLRLESEISLSDELVLIVRKDPEDQHILIRRYVLSDYDRKAGFRRLEGVDDATHPPMLGRGELRLASPPFSGLNPVDQEYYLVNFDSSAFIALNQPTRAQPYASWDASSFSSVYSAESAVSEALPFELIDASEAGGAAAALAALGARDYALLTEYGGDQRIRELAASIVGEGSGYWDSVQAVYESLKYGEYRYSLKPGIAADGDQLGRFLFESKKGYCSYFAFSMTLLLRSLGIPARTAVGFFLDPGIAAFDYFPVRADMAHAWVEVFFPEYGWIEYDPTTEQPAEGEEFRFGSGVPPEQFEKLMREILANRDRLRDESEEGPPSIADRLPSLIASAAAFARERWVLICALLLPLWAVAARGGLFLAHLLARSPRRAALLLCAHALRRAAAAGHRRRRDESLGEFARRTDAAADLRLSALMELRAKALYAPRFGAADAAAVRAEYRVFSACCARSIPPARRFLAWIVPFAGVRLRARSSFPALLAGVLLLSGDPAGAQDAADDPFVEIEELIAASRWDAAVEKLRNAVVRFPEDTRYPIALGDLFADRKLYGLAWEEYRAAERVDGNDPALLHRLAIAAGRLNMDERSAAYLERVTALRPDDRDAAEDLAWMYFKLHRLREGERFLLDAIERLGSDPGFSMTLGTIYSDLYDYQASSRWYSAAIDEARKTGARTFEAVAQYNLSILEAKHYKYAEAFRRTELSLEAADRSSGHLARGELFLRRLEFARTYAEYERAYEIDVSPLSKLNLADAYLNAGRLAEARSYAESALAVTDLSWMFNYGTNRTQYQRDVHDILAEAYAGLANLERSYPRAGPLEAAAGFAAAAAHDFRSARHRALFREYARRCAASYEGAAQPLDALLNYYDAFGAYADKASYYLREAHALERSLVPASVPRYELERGLLEKSVRRIEAALPLLDPLWQKDLAARAYAALAVLRPERSAEGRDAAERLFALNRGALRRAGVRLPVSLRVEGSAKAAAALGRTLRRSGFRVTGDDPSCRFSLELRVEDGAVRCALYDTLRGSYPLRKAFPLPSLSAKDRAAFGRALADAVFLAQ